MITHRYRRPEETSDEARTFRQALCGAVVQRRRLRQTMDGVTCSSCKATDNAARAEQHERGTGGRTVCGLQIVAASARSWGIAAKPIRLTCAKCVAWWVDRLIALQAKLERAESLGAGSESLDVQADRARIKQLAAMMARAP